MEHDGAVGLRSGIDSLLDGGCIQRGAVALGAVIVGAEFGAVELAWLNDPRPGLHGVQRPGHRAVVRGPVAARLQRPGHLDGACHVPQYS